MKRAETSWNVLFLVSVGIVVATFWYGFLRPAEVRKTDPGELGRVRMLVKTAKARTEALDRKVQAQVFDADLQTLAGIALETVNGLAIKSHLQLASFRSEKPTTVAGLNQAPYVAVVEGSFLDLQTLLSRLESPGSKLGVQMLQITTSDESPGKVSATLGLVAHTRAIESTVTEER